MPTIVKISKAPNTVDVTQSSSRVQIITGKGVKGDPGSQGAAVEFAAIALSTLSGQTAVKSVVGGVEYADITNAADVGTITGITQTAAQINTVVEVQFTGEIDDLTWAYNVGPIFVGLNGALVQAIPANAVWVQQVGYMISPTQLLISIKPALLLAKGN